MRPAPAAWIANVDGRSENQPCRHGSQPPTRPRSSRKAARSSDPQDAPELLAHDPRSVFAMLYERDALQGEGGPEHVPTMPLGQAASLTSIFLAWLRAGFGMVTFKTPFDNVALTVDGSMPGGNCRTR